jgi:hypothetical protein
MDVAVRRSEGRAPTVGAFRRCMEQLPRTAVHEDRWGGIPWGGIPPGWRTSTELPTEGALRRQRKSWPPQVLNGPRGKSAFLEIPLRQLRVD